MDLNWNPTVNAVNFAVNNAYLSSYGNFPVGYSQAIVMGVYTTLSGDSFLVSSETAPNNEVLAAINYDGSTPYPSVLSAGYSFHMASKIKAGILTVYKDNTSNSTAYGAAPVLSNASFFGGSVNDGAGSPASAYDGYTRHFITGSGDINHSALVTRLNTFYTSRGL